MSGTDRAARPSAGGIVRTIVGGAVIGCMPVALAISYAAVI
ncbi:MAG: hypothetical protein WBF53_00365 [Litorimonas sp.]